ncbi:hypothetical protein QTP70_026468, partial [Hemibagrus guttatus]
MILRGESVSDPADGGHEIFQAADHYDFALLLSGTESQCYWHFARQNGRFYLTYMVQWVSGMTAGKHIAVSIFSPNGVLLSYTDNTMGQMNFQAKETVAIMDFVDPILSLAEKLYDLCSEVKANKKRCKRLAERVSSLVELVKVVKNNGLGKNPTIVQRGLRELTFTLESAKEVVNKYASSSCLKRIVKVQNLGEEFGTLNERLNDAAQLLSLALQVEQRDRMDIVFKEDRRRKEDEDDRRYDYEELQNLLQSLAEEKEKTKVSVDAVQVTVEQTQKDVQDIKGILESLRRPSLHLQDIREIRPEELTYDIPIEPIMKTDNSELYKGEYNKFSVAIKKYAYPGSTSPKQVRSIFNKEVETMKRFESPHILRMFGICVQNENGFLWILFSPLSVQKHADAMLGYAKLSPDVRPNPTYLIVMEFCEKGNLRQLLDGSSKLPWERKICMCLDAAQGLYRLHQSEEKCKVHGCLTSSKFLVAAGYRIKLGGFELAKTETSLKNSKQKKYSSMTYISPQQLQDINHQYDKACEIYSFGIVLWEIATRQIPFKGIFLDPVIFILLLYLDCSSYASIHQKVYVEKAMEPLPHDCPRQLMELINACRSFEAFTRPSAG